MTWILVATLLGLLYLATNQERILDRKSFRQAWIWFAMVPMSHFVFALLRADNSRSTRDLALTEIWADGVAWLLLGISLLFLLGALVSKEEESEE